MRVLLVDDNETNLKLLRVTLRGAGHDTEEAADGIEALGLLSTGRFHAVITDVLMPRMDGYRLAYRIRRTPAIQDILVVVYSSTYTGESDEQVAINVGADLFLRRPASPEALLAALGTAAEGRRPRQQAVAPASELDALKEYSEGLVRRLEAANRELEAARDGLAAAYDAARQSERKHRELVAFAPIGIFRSTRGGRFVSANIALARLLGYGSVEALLAVDIPVLYANREDRERLIAEIGRPGGVGNFEALWRRRDDSTFWVRLDARVVRGEEGGIEYETFVHDIDQRKKAEESQQQLLRAVEQAENVIFLTDPSGRITYVNPSFEALYGYRKEEVLGQTPRVLKSGRHDAAFYEAFWKRLLSGEVVREEMVNRARDGRLVTVESSANPLLDRDGKRMGFVAVQNDVTERRLLEHQFRQAQKMEAVGQLAGGVAHDFNNLLTAILGYAELLAEKVKGQPKETEDVEEIRRAGERAATLTRQLLAFSRQQVFERKVLDVNRLILDLKKMFRRLIGEDIELETVLDPHLAAVSADAGQLEQVVMNLIVNARDAMPRGGKLTLETSNVSLDEGYARLHPPVQPGHYAMLSVSDTGIGMDAETRSRIFEPFFTTKELGKGTGLGLATVYGIVKQSGGYIWVYSEPGRGATFKVYLPTTEQAPAETSEPAGKRTLHGSETVLLVEDEASVRTLTRAILEAYGYQVLEAGTPQAALEFAGQRPVDLLLTDVVMPAMGGPELASRIEAIRPGLKVLYMSGYTDDTIFRHGHLKRGSLFLQKPFTPEILARKVRDALGN